MMKPTAFFLVLILTLTVSLGRAMEPVPDNSHSQELKTDGSYSQKQKARDAITLSIEELQGITNFVKIIPRLKFLWTTHHIPELDICVNRLVNNLDAIKSTLHRLSPLKRTGLSSDANSLKREMVHGVNLGNSCGKSFRKVDEIVGSMLTRKLTDLSMAIGAVVRHVSLMGREVNHVEIKVNPGGGDA